MAEKEAESASQISPRGKNGGTSAPQRTNNAPAEREREREFLSCVKNTAYESIHAFLFKKRLIMMALVGSQTGSVNEHQVLKPTEAPPPALYTRGETGRSHSGECHY